jgi:hypothetical protein
VEAPGRVASAVVTGARDVLDRLMPPFNVEYYNLDRPHRSLGLQSPLPRPSVRDGPVTRRAVLGGLHHVYAHAA